ncbi:MAG TPA: hypothetical protein VFE05_18845 [Longimicrobiaceae bacterium]|jgi:hypothetical protein|nr:hypothetical protein [Longimicrobiaceae bacterium]
MDRYGSDYEGRMWSTHSAGNDRGWFGGGGYDRDFGGRGAYGGNGMRGPKPACQEHYGMDAGEARRGMYDRDFQGGRGSYGGQGGWERSYGGGYSGQGGPRQSYMAGNGYGGAGRGIGGYDREMRGGQGGTG